MKSEPMITLRILVLMRGLNNKLILILSIIFLVFFSCKPKKEITIDDKSMQTALEQDRGSDFRVMFYNVENLFDVVDDSLTRDEEFTPKGTRYWNTYKYKEKLNKVYKVITAVGGWEPPEVIGLCEIENRGVIDDLLKYTPLSKHNYDIVHKESPDSRGIDVALLYNKEKFIPIISDFFEINFPHTSRTTRDVLYVKGKTNKEDTLHLFINHWPSRWGGQLESEPNRLFVASVVRSKVDSIFELDHDACIILTGDFNDEPEDKSMLEVLKAELEYTDIKSGHLYNISYNLENKKGLGSHKYQGNWGLLDQFVVSGSLLNKSKRIYTDLEHVNIFKSDFLLEKDEANIGFKPFRTFIGLKYNGGYSDHLPTYLDLIRK